VSSSILLSSLEPGKAPSPWVAHYPDHVPATLDYPHEPIWWLLDKTSHDFPDRIACHYYQQQMTYGQLYDAARRTASALVRRGVQPGMRVGLLLPNTPEYLIAAYGIWMAGGVVVSISPLMCAAEAAGLVEATQCHTVIGLDVLAPLVLNERFDSRRLIVVSLQDRLPHWQRFIYAFIRLKRIGWRAELSGLGSTPLQQEIDRGDPNFVPVRREGESPAYILPTGGTTGAPKAVVLSHANLMANAWQLFYWAEQRIGRETILAVIPFFHSYGLSSCVTAGVAGAATMVLFHRFKPDAVLRLIQHHRPSCFTAVPTMLAGLSERLAQRRYDVSSLEYCISGGAALDLAVGEQFARYTGGKVVQGYGLSEASPVTHTGPLDGTARTGTIGLPLPDTEAVIVDADTGTRVLPPGEVGELVIRGPQVMHGYWNNEEETRRVIRHGWLFTGDLAMCDADGFFTIVDRKKDIIITSGFKVYPADVELVLRRYPGVRDVAVVGVPNPPRGEQVKAVLSLERGAKFNRHAFDRFTADNLSRHKRPRTVQIVDGDLPRSFLGKVLRRELRGPCNGRTHPDHQSSKTDIGMKLSGSEAVLPSALTETSDNAS